MCCEACSRTWWDSSTGRSSLISLTCCRYCGYICGSQHCQNKSTKKKFHFLLMCVCMKNQHSQQRLHLLPVTNTYFLFFDYLISTQGSRFTTSSTYNVCVYVAITHKFIKKSCPSFGHRALRLANQFARELVCFKNSPQRRLVDVLKEDKEILG